MTRITGSEITWLSPVSGKYISPPPPWNINNGTFVYLIPRGDDKMFYSHIDIDIVIKNVLSYLFISSDIGYAVSLLARLLILIKKGGLLQLKFGVVGVGVGVNIYLWAR